MTTKQVYSIYISAEVREKARDCGLNISKITENTLCFLLQRLDDSPTIPETASTSTDLQKSSTEVQA
jgi:hypothetical protein